MIIATVTTCVPRWESYQKLRRNFERLGFPFELRTFQNSIEVGSRRLNARCNGRAALTFARQHLPEDGWVLYLEDDVELGDELPKVLPRLVRAGRDETIDCWYLCNRKNGVLRQFGLGSLVVNELKFPVFGSHALLIPRRHLAGILNHPWTQTIDASIFRPMYRDGGKILQVIDPVLAEHKGEYSTYSPDQKQKLEVNHANQTDCCAPG